MSSARVHSSRTGRPTARETWAASTAGSKNSRRPNDPPPRTTCSVTRSTGRPRVRAIVWAATIGLFDGSHSSARSARTSATQLSTSSGAWGTKAKSKVRSTVSDPGVGSANGGTAAASCDRMPASDRCAPGPGFHWIARASRAASAWSNVAATTATPVGMRATATTPGIARAAASSTERTVPPSVGGRATTHGSASGTGRSCVYTARPVTMSRASMRDVGWPMTVKSAGSLGTGGTAGTTMVAASTDSSP